MEGENYSKKLEDAEKIKNQAIKILQNELLEKN
jgi:hypothetical protein